MTYTLVDDLVAAYVVDRSTVSVDTYLQQYCLAKRMETKIEISKLHALLFACYCRMSGWHVIPHKSLLRAFTTN